MEAHSSGLLREMQLTMPHAMPAENAGCICFRARSSHNRTVHLRTLPLPLSSPGILLGCLRMEALLSLEPALELTGTLARDLQGDYLPLLPSVLAALADLVDEGGCFAVGLYVAGLLV